MPTDALRWEDKVRWTRKRGALPIGLAWSFDKLLAEIDALRARLAALEGMVENQAKTIDEQEARVAALEEAGDGLLEDAIPLLEVDVSDEVWLESKHRLLAAFARWREASSGAGSHQTHGQRADSSDKARPAPETPEVETLAGVPVDELYKPL